MNISQPISWDFHIASNSVPSSYSPVRTNLQSAPGAKALGQTSDPTGGAPSTGQPPSSSGDGFSPGDSLNGGSDHFRSAAETSVISNSDRNQDVDMRNFQAQPPQGQTLMSDINASDLRMQTGCPTGGNETLSLPGLPTFNPIETGKAESSSVLLDELLPSTAVVLELVDTFFSRFHPLLPCIHHESFLKRLAQGGHSVASDPLVWTILGVAAASHHVPQIQALQQVWLARARLLFDKNVSQSLSPTSSLQAAVWLAFQAWVSADLTEAWFLVGKAYRIANILRLDRIDASRPRQLISMVPGPRNAIEVEEQRKVMWSLLYLERSLACLGGFMLSINERFFQVDYPMDDKTFQNMNYRVSSSSRVFCPSVSVTFSISTVLH